MSLDPGHFDTIQQQCCWCLLRLELIWALCILTAWGLPSGGIHLLPWDKWFTPEYTQIMYSQQSWKFYSHSTHFWCFWGGVPCRGAGIAQWLERRTRDWKVVGSNPCWSGGRIFFSRVDFLCWLLFRYLFHPRVTAVARKRSRSFCQRSRLQLNTHTPYVCGFAWSDMEHGCLVYTGLAPRRLQFHVAPAMPAL